MQKSYSKKNPVQIFSLFLTAVGQFNIAARPTSRREVELNETISASRIVLIKTTKPKEHLNIMDRFWGWPFDKMWRYD